MASSRARRSSERGGCGTAIGVLLLIGLVIEYWYVALALCCVIALVVFAGARRRRRTERHRSGPADPWLNEVSVALADLGLAEYSRNGSAAIGGVQTIGNIVMRNRCLEIDIAMLGAQQATHRAEMALRADPPTRAALSEGHRAIVGRDGVIFVARSRRGVVDEALLDDVVRVVDRLPVDILPSSFPSPSIRVAPPTGGDDALNGLRALSELHREGSLTDEEFADKKAALLKRI